MSSASMIVLLGIGLVCLMQWLRQKERDRIHRHWMRLPTFDSYSAQTKPHLNRAGSSCYHCGSRSVRQFGLAFRKDQRRIHSCNRCNTALYRTFR